MNMLFFSLGFVFAVIGAGAVDGTATISTVVFWSGMSIISFIIGLIIGEKE
jgi:hypothetical protein